jgi:hypothetical protein
VPVDVRAWLSTIAWRRALDLARRERDSLPLDTGVASADDPQARVIEAQELGRVVAAFSELPARQRKALALSALEGRSLEEIGDALDVAPDTAKSLVARSRRTLTHRLAAADLDCAEARLQMESAALRGVRLGGEVTLHVQSCRVCARAHRAIRRRRRVAALLPLGLIVRTLGVRDRIRDLVAFNPAWEAQVGAAKMCTAACLSVGAAGAAATPAVTVVSPIVAHSSTPVPKTVKPAKPHHHKKKAKKPKPTPTATATIAYAKATPTWTPTPTPTQVAQVNKKKARVHLVGADQVTGGGEDVVGGGGESEEAPGLARAEKTPAPTPVETPVPTPPAG